MNTQSMEFARTPIEARPACGAAGTGTEDARADRRQYLLFYVLCFALFLVVALLCRVLPRAWRPFTQAGDKHSSVVSEVRNAVCAVLPFVFMA